MKCTTPTCFPRLGLATLARLAPPPRPRPPAWFHSSSSSSSKRSLYPGHVPVNAFQNSLLAVGSAFASLIDTSRHGQSSRVTPFYYHLNSLWLYYNNRHGGGIIRNHRRPFPRSLAHRNSLHPLWSLPPQGTTAHHRGERQFGEVVTDAGGESGEGICRLVAKEQGHARYSGSGEGESSAPGSWQDKTNQMESSS